MYMPNPRVMSRKSLTLIIGIIVAIFIAFSTYILSKTNESSKSTNSGKKESSLQIIQKTEGHIQPIISLIHEFKNYSK